MDNHTDADSNDSLDDTEIKKIVEQSLGPDIDPDEATASTGSQDRRSDSLGADVRANYDPDSTARGG